MLKGLWNYTKQYLLGGPEERRRVIYQVGLRIRGIDVAGSSIEELGLNGERSHEHSNSGGPDLDRVLGQMKLPPELAVLDLGCGKGGALLTLGRHFQRVDGLDLSPELLRVAARNLEKFGMTARLIETDAAGFREYDPYSVVYMFNPFPAPVVEAALANIGESLRRAPRPFWLIYKNPKFHDLVAMAGFHAAAEYPGGGLPFRVYRAEGK